MSLKRKKLIGQILVEMGSLKEDKLLDYVKKAEEEMTPLGAYLLNEDLITERDFAKAIAQQHELEFIEVADKDVEQVAMEAIPASLAVEHKILPYKFEDEELLIVVADPTKREVFDEIEAVVEVKYRVLVAPASQLEELLKELYSHSSSDEEVQKIIDKMAAHKEAIADPFQSDAEDMGKATSIEIVINKIIEDALKNHSSDIHIEPDDEELRVRKRIDGVLVQREKFPLELHSPLVSRIKIMANLDIAEKRTAQDGRFRHSVGDRFIDFRASTLPTVKGEKVVLRILDKKNLKVHLEDLGMDRSMLQNLRQALKNPHGIILVTGPTGSGKTTTVYSMLNEINSIETNIITVEDPVEYQFPLVNQVQVNSKIGLSFANVLRSILRQDPDVIMLGEIRDFETADIAIRAALTGHLVISTIHTNNAISTVSRLQDIGIEPFLISSSLVMVVAQRLVRMLCAHCKVKVDKLEDAENADEEVVFRDHGPFCRKVGCDKCLNSGYAGRIPVFEIFLPDVSIKIAIKNGGQEEDIIKLAKKSGFIQLSEDAMNKFKKGLTTYDEVLRIKGSIESEGGKTTLEAEESEI